MVARGRLQQQVNFFEHVAERFGLAAIRWHTFMVRQGSGWRKLPAIFLNAPSGTTDHQAARQIQNRVII